MLLARFQSYLSSFYEAPSEYDVYDFLITDARLADALTPKGHCDNDERLLVAQSAEGVALSVYLEQTMLAQLSRDDPFIDLHDGNMSAFMLAVEGVSHFNYLCWNAAFDKSVTLLELELQAEVDKYVTATALLGAQGNSKSASALHEILFDRIKFRDDLTEQNLERYRDANHYAAKYCRSLRSNFPDSHGESCFRNELRRFYRLTQNEKIRRIEAIG
jgi:hypothetical protein